MSDVMGASVTRLEQLGVRVRFVPTLSEGAIYFRTFGLAVVDSDLSQNERDAILDGIGDEVRIRRELDELLLHRSKRERAV